MKAPRDGVKKTLLIRAGGGQALKCLTVALCFLLLLFYGQADVLEAYHAVQSKAVRMLRNERLSDAHSASSSNTSQHLLSHVPRTLAWVTRNLSSSEPSRSHTLQNLTALASNVNISKLLTSQTSGHLSSAAENLSAIVPSFSSILSTNSSAGDVFISELLLPNMPRNASLLASTKNSSEHLIRGTPGSTSLAARGTNNSNPLASGILRNMTTMLGNAPVSAPSKTNINASASSASNATILSTTKSIGQGLQPCTEDSFAHTKNFTGRWVNSPKEDFNGFYTMLTDCPKFVQEFDCKNPFLTGGPAVNPDLIHQEYRQVFRADQCQLRSFDAQAFSKKMAMRKLIMVGDSIMRLNFYSLACLMKSEITEGSATEWRRSSVQWQGDYTSDWAEHGPREVTKQFVGDFVTSTGFEVHLRDFGTFNDTLLEHVLSDFVPMQSNDVLLINFGAWYPRWVWGQNEANWRAWQAHMDRLFLNLLAKLPLQVIWKQHAPLHFGGSTGTDLMFEGLLPGGPFQYGCYPADVGEFWYDDYIKDLLQGPKCKDACARIKVLPIFEMSRQRPNAHHGSMGRGVAMGKADCRHWCNAVTDWWTILLYNMLT